MACAFSPDDASIVICDANVSIWRTRVFEHVATFTGHKFGVSPITAHVIVMCALKHPNKCDIKMSICLLLQVRQVAWSPDSRMLVSFAGDWLLRLWDVDTQNFALEASTAQVGLMMDTNAADRFGLNVSLCLFSNIFLMCLTGFAKWQQNSINLIKVLFSFFNNSRFSLFFFQFLFA
jgi:WD40 repeat protein